MTNLTPERLEEMQTICENYDWVPRDLVLELIEEIKRLRSENKVVLTPGSLGPNSWLKEEG